MTSFLHRYLCGLKAFQLLTDHKPLVHSFSIWALLRYEAQMQQNDTCLLRKRREEIDVPKSTVKIAQCSPPPPYLTLPLSQTGKPRQNCCFMAFGTFLPSGRACFILFVYPITFETWDSCHAHLPEFGFPFFRCISPKCWVSDWPAT